MDKLVNISRHLSHCHRGRPSFLPENFQADETSLKFLLGLGPTVPELDISGLPVFQKTTFSMCLPEVKDHLKQYTGTFFHKYFK